MANSPVFDRERHRERQNRGITFISREAGMASTGAWTLCRAWERGELNHKSPAAKALIPAPASTLLANPLFCSDSSCPNAWHSGLWEWKICITAGKTWTSSYDFSLILGALELNWIEKGGRCCGIYFSFSSDNIHVDDCNRQTNKFWLQGILENIALNCLKQCREGMEIGIHIVLCCTGAR